MWNNAKIDLGGRFISDGIRFRTDPNWFLLGFKSSDTNLEAWTGFHSQNPMVIVTEGSGIPDSIYNAIEGLLTGDSRLLIVLNPNHRNGECYNAFRSKLYKHYTLNCLEAPNVKARKLIYQGQVGYDWVCNVMSKPGWVSPLRKDEVLKDKNDFEWEGKWYRPSNLFRVKVLGEWPLEDADQLIPLHWVESAIQRWYDLKTAKASSPGFQQQPGLLRLGVDVAGMGADSTILAYRREMELVKLETVATTDHMETVGRIVNALQRGGTGYVDTIGEGAGVYSRLRELAVPCESVKFSESAEGLRDVTGERTFANMRAFCWWAIRDNLDPELKGSLALPPDDDLILDLTTPKFKINSRGGILIQSKDEIRKILGRSPDKGDALANTFYPGAVSEDQEYTDVYDLDAELDSGVLSEI